MSFKKENGKSKDKGKKKAEGEFNVKIEEVNTLSGDSGNEEEDILLTSSVEPSTLVTTNNILVQDQIMDLGASFHLTPYCQWFTTMMQRGRAKFDLTMLLPATSKGLLTSS